MKYQEHLECVEDQLKIQNIEYDSAWDSEYSFECYGDDYLQPKN